MNIYYILKVCSLIMVSLAVVSANRQRINTKQQEDPLGFFQYVNVPAYLQYEFGFNRGSFDHQVSRQEQFNNGDFRSKVKWSDSYEGMGAHYFDYNHGGSNLPEYTAPEYQVPNYNVPPPDSNPAATQDLPQSSLDTLFRFPPRPEHQF